MAEPDVKKVPPDGGYGWVVVCAYALNNIVVLPLITSFGLIIQQAIVETDLTKSQGTLIIILNHSFGMFLSLFGGPLLKRFGYRKIATGGAICISLGLILTSFSRAYWMYILSYSIINSTGIAVTMAAFNLAINSFFKEKRTRAVGLAMSITGLGAIYMPLLIEGLITVYDWRNAVRMLGAICLHSLVGATLLRPVKRYLKDSTPAAEELVPLKNSLTVEFVESEVQDSKQNGLTSLPILNEIKSVAVDQNNHTLPPKSISMRSLSSSSSLETRNAVSHPDITKKNTQPPLTASRYKWWESQEINLGSSINIFCESDMSSNKLDMSSKRNEIRNKDELESKKKPGGIHDIVEFFDLTLLKDPIFVNILLGLSIASCVETTFSLLLPIILEDMLNFEVGECAKIMAVIGFSDTLFRFISPFIGEWCHKSPRVMYLTSLLMIVFTRSILLFTTTFKGMLFVAIAIGITKGMRTVYMNVVIPSYIPLERLPFASGIQMFVNGIMTISIASIFHRLRDLSGAYKFPIIILNVITLLTVFMWCTEFLCLRLKNNLSATKA